MSRVRKGRPGRKERLALPDPRARRANQARRDLSGRQGRKAIPDPPASQDLTMGEKGDKGDKGDPGSAGIRVLEPVGGGATSSCDDGEALIGAWCTGTYQSYPLRVGPGANEASCTAAENADIKVVIVCAKQG